MMSNENKSQENFSLHSGGLMMDAEALSRLLESKENATLEFKLKVPPVVPLARMISGMANTKGGFLVVGYDEQSATPVGVDNIAATVAVIERAAGLSTPPIDCRVSVVQLGNKTMVVAEIGQATLGPHFVNGVAFERSDQRAVPMSEDSLRRAFGLTGQQAELASIPLTDLIDIMNRLLERVTELNAKVHEESLKAEDLRQQMRQSSRLVSKLPEWALSALVGAVVTKLLGL